MDDKFWTMPAFHLSSRLRGFPSSTDESLCVLSGVLHVQTKKGHQSRCVLCHDDMMKIIHSPDEDYHPYYILLLWWWWWWWWWRWWWMWWVRMMMTINIITRYYDHTTIVIMTVVMICWFFRMVQVMFSRRNSRAFNLICLALYTPIIKTYVYTYIYIYVL
jgi:hypothetical protein